MKNFTTKLALISLAAIGQIASASLVVNGSFEDVTLPGRNYDFFTSITGWSAEKDVIEIGRASVYGVTGQDKMNVIELDANNNATVAQSFAGLTSGLEYVLDFKSALRNDRAASDCIVEVLWNDSLVLTVTPTSTVMAPSTVSFLAQAGSNKLSFRGAGTNTSFGALVDDVKMEAVPEPASMIAMGVGLVGLIRRNRSRKSA